MYQILEHSSIPDPRPQTPAKLDEKHRPHHSVPSLAIDNKEAARASIKAWYAKKTGDLLTTTPLSTPEQTTEDQLSDSKKVLDVSSPAATNKTLTHLPLDTLREIVPYLTLSETLHLLTTNKTFYQQRNDLLSAFVEQTKLVLPEILIHAIKNQDVDLIMSLTDLAKVKNWLNIPDTYGNTAGFYALDPLNLALYKYLLACGLDPEQPLALSQPWREFGQASIRNPRSILKAIAPEPSAQLAVLAILREYYGALRSLNAYIDGQTLALWQYQLLDKDRDNAAYNSLPYIQLMKATKEGNAGEIERLLSEAEQRISKGDGSFIVGDSKSNPMFHSLACSDQDGENPLTTALSRHEIGLIDRLINVGLDARVIAPNLLTRAWSWMLNPAHHGIGDIEHIKQGKALVAILQKHYGDKAIFSARPLTYWQMKFECQHLLYDRTRVYFAVLEKDYRLAKSLVESGSEFLFHPFSTAPLRDLTSEISLYKLLMLGLSQKNVSSVIVIEITELLMAIIEKLTPQNINQLIGGKALIHYLAQTPFCHNLISVLCKKPAVEINLLDCSSRQSAFDYALANKNWEYMTILRQHKAVSCVKTLHYKAPVYLHNFEDVNRLLDLGISPFINYVSFQELLFLEKKHEPNYKDYIIKLIAVIPDTLVNSYLTYRIRLPNYFSLKNKRLAGQATLIRIPLLGFLILQNYLEPLPLLKTKGLLAKQPIIFLEAAELGIAANSPPTYPLWYYIKKGGSDLDIIGLLQCGLDPGGIICDLDGFKDPDVLRLLTLLVKGLSSADGQAINAPIQGHPLSYWVAYYSKKFNWPDTTLQPLVMMMLCKKVDYAIFLAQATELRHTLLLNILRQHNPQKIKAEVKLLGGRGSSSLFAPPLQTVTTTALTPPSINPEPAARVNSI